MNDEASRAESREAASHGLRRHVLHCSTAWVELMSRTWIPPSFAFPIFYPFLYTSGKRDQQSTIHEVSRVSPREGGKVEVAKASSVSGWRVNV